MAEEALDAVSRTDPGNHVNLVTRGDHGHTEAYLYGALDEAVDDVRWEFVDRCGCEGYVTRAFVRATSPVWRPLSTSGGRRG